MLYNTYLQHVPEKSLFLPFYNTDSTLIRMTFEDFKSWVKTLPDPPDRAVWWELKARLDAVEAPLPTPEDAPTGQPTAVAAPRVVEAVGWSDEVEDCPPQVPEEDWNGDGGVTAEAVRALRKQQKRTFALPEADSSPNLS
jgi:hypothetical protein